METIRPDDDTYEKRTDIAFNLKWVAGCAAAAVLAIVLAIPLGLSLVALLPPFVLVVIVAWAYVGWRNHVVRRGREPDARGGYVELVGGRESRETPATTTNREAHP